MSHKLGEGADGQNSHSRVLPTPSASPQCTVCDEICCIRRRFQSGLTPCAWRTRCCCPLSKVRKGVERHGMSGQPNRPEQPVEACTCLRATCPAHSTTSKHCAAVAEPLSGVQARAHRPLHYRHHEQPCWHVGVRDRRARARAPPALTLACWPLQVSNQRACLVLRMASMVK